MNFSTVRSERITAIISTVVAVIILAAGVTAHQSHNAPVDDLVQLESDLRFQLEAGFRHDTDERATRLAQLEEVFQAWQQSPRLPADQELVATWLLEATIRSMPGSSEPMPTIPQFGQQPPAPQSTTQPTADLLEESSAPTDDFDLPKRVPTLADPISTADVSEAYISEAVKIPQHTFLEPALEEATAEFVPINLTELAARIAGYHDGLDEIETALIATDSDDFSALSQRIRQLDAMTADFHFVRLYFEALTDQERLSVAVPRSMSETLSEIERHLDRNQEALDGDFLGQLDSGHQEHLAQLRQQLADVAHRIDR